MATAYDIESDRISDAFARIEEELFESMFRNLERHRVEEAESGYEWTQWQTAQIAELEQYARDNGLRYGERFDRLNERIDDAIRNAYTESGDAQEAFLLRALQDGGEIERQEGFLRLPRERMDALVAATHSDMMKAEYATLRKASDIYRQTIFDAQVYATSGAGTYAKAIDMATHDFLAKGINGIRYRNGSMHGIDEYSRMAVRTAARRAALVAEGESRKRRGVHTVYVDARPDACPECMEWVGRVLIDDVYSGGTAEESQETGYPLLSEAMAQGLFHPNCRDTMSTYVEGISEPPDKPTEAEKRRAEAAEAEEQRLDAAEDNADRYGRLERFSLDFGNQSAAAEKAVEWERKAAEAQAAVSSAEQLSKALSSAGISNAHAAEITRIAESAGGRGEELFRDAAGELQLHPTTGADAFYSSTDRHITINMSKVADPLERRDKKAFQTFFHEYGHFIDNRATGYATMTVQQGNTLWKMSDNLSHRMGLGKSVKDEVAALLKSIKAEHHFSSIGLAKEFLEKEIFGIYRTNPELLGGITDIIQGATNSTCCYSFWTPNHTKDYYSGATRGLAKLSFESFAHFYECLMANPEALETLKHYLPESYELFLRILEAM